MAPLSVLPGRVRFETSELIGCKEGCIFLEKNLLSVKGVVEVLTSHRTGSILVKFDESLVTRKGIDVYVGKALQVVTTKGEWQAGVQSDRRESPFRGSSFNAGHFAMEMALHAFLPAPLDLLLPAAATAFRR